MQTHLHSWILPQSLCHRALNSWQTYTYTYKNTHIEGAEWKCDRGRQMFIAQLPLLEDNCLQLQLYWSISQMWQQVKQLRKQTQQRAERKLKSTHMAGFHFNHMRLYSHTLYLCVWKIFLGIHMQILQVV